MYPSEYNEDNHHNQHSPLNEQNIIFFFFFNDTATTEIYTLSLHDALPISSSRESDASFKANAPDAGAKAANRAQEALTPELAPILPLKVLDAGPFPRISLGRKPSSL